MQFKNNYAETASYRMLAEDVRKEEWLSSIPEQKAAIIVMEGVSMYLTPQELQALLTKLSDCFEQVALLMDCYTVFAAKMSRYKNPIRDVGVTEVYGIDHPERLQCGELVYIKEHEMTPQKYIDELSGIEKSVFSKLYAGHFSKKLYRLFEYRKG